MLTQKSYVKIDNCDRGHRLLCFCDSRTKLSRPKLVGCIAVLILTVIFVVSACVSRKHCFQNDSCNPQNSLGNDRASRRSRGKLKPSCGVTEKIDPLKRLPQSIIIGVRKAGTGAMLHFLEMHPDVQVSSRELAFFDFDYNKGIEWYRDQFPVSYKGQITMEKTSNYFHNRNTIERIYNMNSTIKIILVVRDPVERAISDHLQRKLTVETDVNFPSFDEMIQEPDLEDLKFKILKPSLYHRHMKKWLEYFPLEQIHIVDGENLVKNPYEETFKVETFLGLQHCVSKENFVFSNKKGFYCLNKPRRYGYRTRCLPKSKGRKHPDVKTEVIQNLKAYFRPLNEKFYKLINRRFEW